MHVAAQDPEGTLLPGEVEECEQACGAERLLKALIESGGHPIIINGQAN